MYLYIPIKYLYFKFNYFKLLEFVIMLHESAKSLYTESTGVFLFLNLFNVCQSKPI